jgi:hypothetical protein
MKTEKRNIRKCNESNVHTKAFETVTGFRPGISKF